MGRRVVLEGSLIVARPPRDALPLFTPEGERRWVPGWDPVYPDASAADRTEPGTVFVTHGDHGATTWLVLDRRDHRMRYARVTEGRTAGTVTVSCQNRDDRATTEVTVVYDLTALSDGGTDDIEHLASDYPGYLAEWERLIADLDR